MLENPNSLVSKVFKARYFKHTDIMEAGIGANPYYIWQSLMWSKDILKIGTFWKVSTGENINTRKDAWIPELNSGRITSNLSYDNNTSVNSLILPSKAWNINRLNNLFLPFKTEAIKRIHIGHSNRPDSCYWKFERKGTYSVRTGY